MNYVQENDGYITQSKIKCYMKSKEAYKKVYVDKINTSHLKSSKALELWTMVDLFVLTQDEFRDKYVYLDWVTLKADLIALCEKEWIELDKKDKVDEIKGKICWTKKLITPADWKTITSVDAELRRQPIFDYDWEYENQKELIAEYKWFKLKGKIDRLWETIRDLKTTKDLEYKSRCMQTKFQSDISTHDEYGYLFQLARYALLVFINTDERKDGVIDAVKTSGNYAYEGYIVDKEILKKIVHTEIIPTLDNMIDDLKHNDLVDEVVQERGNLINNDYYSLLDSTIQKELIKVERAVL